MVGIISDGIGESAALAHEGPSGCTQANTLAVVMCQLAARASCICSKRLWAVQWEATDYCIVDLIL